MRRNFSLPIYRCRLDAIFSLASGLITEIGGLLSHGAVVARGIWPPLCRQCEGRHAGDQNWRYNFAGWGHWKCEDSQ